MVDDGLLVCTSDGGGDITDRGGTWRSIIKYYLLCNGIENSIQTFRRDQGRRGEQRETQNLQK